MNVLMFSGACCAWFRVSFYWAECRDGDGVVPEELTEPLTPFLRCMQGTNQHQPRCRALSGEVGKAVRCTIYPSRPSPCREFNRAGEQGQPNDACDRARAHYGLPPLAAPKPGSIIAQQTLPAAAAGCPADD